MSDLSTVTLTFSDGETLKINENDRIRAFRPIDSNKPRLTGDKKIDKLNNDFYHNFPKDYEYALIQDLDGDIDSDAGLSGLIVLLAQNFNFFDLNDDLKHIYSTSAIVKIENNVESY
ncbi:MAG: hypothetical protein ABF619_07490 [Oenococcus oeni]